MKKWWRKHRHAFFGFIASPLVRLLMSTVRVTYHHEERLTGQSASQIICGLHARGLGACWCWRKRGYWTLVSMSRDGELQNRVYTQYGFRTVRGSSGREGTRATIEAIKLLRNSRETLLIAVDGPRGPRGVAQLGALLMAKKSGAALIPVGLSASRRWRVGSWESYMIPKPFSRMAVTYGEAIFVPQHATEEELETCRQALEDGILAADAEADQISGYVPIPGEKRA